MSIFLFKISKFINFCIAKTWEISRIINDHDVRSSGKLSAMGFGVSIADLNHASDAVSSRWYLEAINYTQFPEQDPFNDL